MRKDTCLGYSLDRLFVLIDSAASLELRQKAAEQICEISRLNKRDYYSIITKLCDYLISDSADTRSVAAFCLDAVLSAARKDCHINLSDDKCDRSTRCFMLADDGDRSYLRISSFNFGAVEDNSSLLLGSGRFEENGALPSKTSGHSSRSRRKSSADEAKDELLLGSDDHMNANGVDFSGSFPIDMNQSIRVICSEFASFEDLKVDDNAEDPSQGKSSIALQAEMFGSQYVMALGDNSEAVEGCIDSKRIKLDVSEGVKVIRDMRNFLYENAFHQRWERRHGSLLGLKLLVRYCLPGSDFNRSLRTGQVVTRFHDELEDLLVRLLCLLMIDRFADYVSDEVAAPVRQECSELLAFCCVRASAQVVKLVLEVLRTLLSDNRWELRHASLLCYQHILPSCEIARLEAGKYITSIMPAFDDNDIDVVSAASCCFLSVADKVVEHLGDRVEPFLARLEGTLHTFDNVCTSSSLILFITKLVPHTNSTQLKCVILDDLYRCLSNMSPQIRAAAVGCIETIVISINNPDDAGNPYLEPALRWTFSCAAAEADINVMDQLLKSWENLVCSVADKAFLASVFERTMHFLFIPLVCPERAKACRSLLLNADDKNALDTDRYCFDENSASSARGADTQYVRIRMYSARCISFMLFRLLEGEEDPATAVETWIKKVFLHVNFNSANHRIGLCILLIELVTRLDKSDVSVEFPASLRSMMWDMLAGPVVYDELSSTLAALHRNCSCFVKQVEEGTKVPLPQPPDRIYTVESVQQICEAYGQINRDNFPHFDFLRADALRDCMNDIVQNCRNEQDTLNLRSTAFASACLISLRSLSEKLNPIIKPLMESVRRDSNYQLQEYSAKALSTLIQQTLVRQLRPHAKVIKNLTAMLCVPTSVVPRFDEFPLKETYELESDVFSRYTCSRYRGIITVAKEEGEAVPESDSSSGDFMGQHNVANNDEVANENDDSLVVTQSAEPAVACRGAELVLKTTCELFGPDVLSAVHELKEQCLSGALKLGTIESESELVSQAQEIINSIRLLEVLIKFMDESAIDQIFPVVVENLCRYGLPCRLMAVRHICARCIAALLSRGKSRLLDVLDTFILRRDPALSSSGIEAYLQGAIECIYYIIVLYDNSIVEYAHQLCVPVLRMTSHQDWYIRLLANRCFATLVRLHPLQTVDANHGGENGGSLLDVLLNPSKLGKKTLPNDLQVELRPYQQEGVNWLYFLRDYNLNGILCDDMGLGKTLQTLCLLIGTWIERKREGERSIPSLVVCPSTVTHHWVAEVDKFFSKLKLQRVAYIGTLAEREQIQRSILSKSSPVDLIVTSYETLRNDVAFFSQLQFLYMVLDEGHVIRSSKTKLSKAIRRISANHRLILSGTPVQNNVSELWNLFNFLMPGYLGTEKQFNARYRKTVLQSKDQKLSRDQENGIIALGALHKQVLPFMLRRLKQDVLSCLPPKIVQYYYCELTPLQTSLYDDFCAGHERAILEGLEVTEGNRHIFKALQYLKKLCNHPILVCNEEHPRWRDVQSFLKNEKLGLGDIKNSGKLLALRELLFQCGVGDDSIDINQKHRILIFCQMKSMIDLVESTVLKHIDGVKYLCLDGSVPQSKRFEIVQKFNNDLSVDILLLTTQVGGLGLSLTGADVVIFVEHDWNPTKDLQAMDRAHRLGQTRTVNVYRLITKGTLEEKIMNLQQFKIDVANTVVSSENSSTSTMDSNIFELYSMRPTSSKIDTPSTDATVSISTSRVGDTVAERKLKDDASTADQAEKAAADLLRRGNVSSLVEGMGQHDKDNDLGASGVAGRSSRGPTCTKTWNAEPAE